MSVRVVVAACAASLAATAASAQQSGPDWVKRPSPEDLYAAWPAAAWDKGEGGKATIHCVVTALGVLRDCRVVSESPQGSGFGAAALNLSAQFLMRPAMKDGKAVASDVTIPINFSAPGKATGSRIRGQEGMTRRVIRGLNWIEAPSVADVQAAVSAKAKAEKVTGHATLECGFTKEGRLLNCSTIQEEPKGYQFAAAAKRLVPRFKAPAVDPQGHAVSDALTDLNFTFAPETFDAATPLIGRPNWTRLPEADDLQAVLPEAAKKAGVLKARVVMSCTVVADGSLTGCRPTTEEPPGYGYGEATVQLARTFRLSVWSAEGLPTVGGQVSVPIRYDFTDTQPAPAK